MHSGVVHTTTGQLAPVYGAPFNWPRISRDFVPQRSEQGCTEHWHHVVLPKLQYWESSQGWPLDPVFIERRLIFDLRKAVRRDDLEFEDEIDWHSINTFWTR